MCWRGRISAALMYRLVYGANQSVSRAQRSSRTGAVLIEQFADRRPHLIHLYRVVRLLPDNLPLGIANDEAVRLESCLFDHLLRAGLFRVQVLSFHIAGEFFFQTAHGGFHFFSYRLSRPAGIIDRKYW